jgi:hypothetical protein
MAKGIKNPTRWKPRISKPTTKPTTKTILIIPPNDTNTTITTNVNQREVVESRFPFALSNKTDVNVAYSYKINLPVNNDLDKIKDYVFSIQMNGKFSEFNLNDDNSVITDDVYAVSSYFFNTHFVHDTTWEPRILPQISNTDIPFEVNCHNVEYNTTTLPASSVEIYNNSDSEYFIYVKFILPPKIYIVGTLNMIYGDVYPASLTNFYRNFVFTVEKINEIK